MGNVESIGALTDLFESLKGKSRIYRRKESVQHKELFQFPSPGFQISPDGLGAHKALPKKQEPVPNMENMANKLVLQRYSPAIVLVNKKGDVLYTSGRVCRYLEPAAGKANWNIFVMIPKSLSYKFSSSFQQAVTENSTIALKNVKIGTEAEKKVVDITIELINETEMLQGLVMIVFTDVRASEKKKETSKANRSSAHSKREAEPELELQISSGTAECSPRDAILPGRALISLRGTAIHQRGNDHIPGRIAVFKRRITDG